MMFPPSLPEDVKGRAFRASNGEMGVILADTGAFLRACRTDKVEVLGWELWIVDHRWDVETNLPVLEPGSWSGGVPRQGSVLPVAYGGHGNIDETERQIAFINLETGVRGEWLPHVRVKFTVDG